MSLNSWRGLGEDAGDRLACLSAPGKDHCQRPPLLAISLDLSRIDVCSDALVAAGATYRAFRMAVTYLRRCGHEVAGSTGVPSNTGADSSSVPARMCETVRS